MVAILNQQKQLKEFIKEYNNLEPLLPQEPLKETLVNGILFSIAGDFSMTFVREAHPHSLFKRLDKDGIIISNTGNGIYRLRNNLPFEAQVIVTKEIPGSSRSWIKCLTKHGTASHLEAIIAKTPGLDEHNKEYADNIMNVFTSANTALVKEQIKEPNMCNAVNELFADQIKEKDLIIAEVRSQLADKDSQLADKDSQIANMGSQLANKDSQISARDAIIAQLQAELKKYSHKK